MDMNTQTWPVAQTDWGWGRRADSDRGTERDVFYYNRTKAREFGVEGHWSPLRAFPLPLSLSLPLFLSLILRVTLPRELTILQRDPWLRARLDDAPRMLRLIGATSSFGGDSERWSYDFSETATAKHSSVYQRSPEERKSKAKKLRVDKSEGEIIFSATRVVVVVSAS